MLFHECNVLKVYFIIILNHKIYFSPLKRSLKFLNLLDLTQKHSVQLHK